MNSANKKTGKTDKNTETNQNKVKGSPQTTFYGVKKAGKYREPKLKRAYTCEDCKKQIPN